MKKIIGSCGIDCSECPTYKATKENDDKLREKTAKEWSQMYSAEIKPSDINCKGCQQKKVLFSHCNECKIRACAHSKGFVTCAECGDFSCDELEGILQFVPEARTILQKARKKLGIIFP
ncbi:MAG: DUF3795 domain-containing protein [bacterium]|nr:DUF3795 domain-containing protein [bacterium]